MANFGGRAAPSVADLLQQALSAYELEKVELFALREEVARLRAAPAIEEGDRGDATGGDVKVSQDSFPTLPLCLANPSVDPPPPALEDIPTNTAEMGSQVQQPQQQDQQQHPQQEQQQLQQSQIELSKAASEVSGATMPRSPSSRKSVLASLQDEIEEGKSNWDGMVETILERGSMVLIALNILMLWLQLQYEGHVAGVGLGLAAHDTWPSLDSTFNILEHSINIAFLLELFVRLLIFRSSYFYKDGAVDRFNVFDMVLVISTSLDLYLIRPALQSSGMNLTIFRPLKFVRLIRTLRVLDSLKFFITLRVMLNAIAASFNALFWSMMLLLVVMLMTALFLCQSVQGAMTDELNLSAGTRDWIFVHYGTPVKAAWSVFEFTFSGGWPNYARKLVEEVSNWYAVFFFLYIISIVFALFRIITALFLKDAMALAAKDADVAIQQKMQQKEQLAQSLLDFFEAADTSGDGFLTKEEFDAILSNQKVKTWLSMMELSLHETEELFAILAGGDGLVSFDEFTKGVLQAKGAARSEDVMAIKRNGQTVASELRGLRKAVSELGALVRNLEGDTRSI